MWCFGWRILLMEMVYVVFWLAHLVFWLAHLVFWLAYCFDGDGLRGVLVGVLGVLIFVSFLEMVYVLF